MGTQLMDIPETGTVEFVGVPVVVVADHAGADWVSLASIREVLGGRTWEGRARGVRSADLTVRHEGVVQTMRFLERDAFFGLAIQHERFEPFRRAVFGLVRARQDGRILEIDPDLRSDPTAQSMLNSFLAYQESKRASRAAIEAKQIAEEAKQIAGRVLEEISVDDDRHTLIGWCKIYGFATYGTKQDAEEGKWLSRRSRKHYGDEPNLHKKGVFGHDSTDGMNSYLEEPFKDWIRLRKPHVDKYRADWRQSHGRGEKAKCPPLSYLWEGALT